MKTITIKSISEINTAAKEFLNSIGNKKVIAFYGEMGAGKTTFIKAICKELGVTDNTSSPTFSLVNEYKFPLVKGGAKDPQGRGISEGSIYHFDFYRIKNESEAFDLGYEDYLYSGNLCLIEWPEKIQNLIPKDCVTVKIEVKENGERVIQIT